MTIQLRPYQERTLTKLWDWFRSHPTGNPIVEAVVGAGKSFMIAETCRRALEYPGTRVLMCVASRELCRQNAEKLLQIWPEAPVGVFSAGLKSKTLGTPILYATIGSIWRRWHQLGHIDLIMIDECHNVSAKDRGMYRTMIRHLKTLCPKVRVIGWTGTAFHGNGVWLHDSDEPLFTDIAAKVTMRELLDAGYLAPLTVPKTETRLSAEGVKQRGGDYIVSQLAKALDQDHLVQSCCDELVAMGKERKRWFVYGVTVEHAHHIRDALVQRGIKSEVISAKTPHNLRDRHLANLRSGYLRAIVNVATMATGIDLPELDLIALMRNTRSPVLYTQIAGRGMRIAEGKTDCMFVDFSDTVIELGPVDLVKGHARQKTCPSEAPTKICGECGAVNAASARVCIECGTEFEIEEKPRHNGSASDAPILSTAKPTAIIEKHLVASVQYREWEGRRTGTPTLRVDYQGPMMRIASEWICFEHQGYPRQKAIAWWAQRAPGTVVPKTVAEATARSIELRAPSAILIDTRPKYPEIKGYEFDTQQKEGDRTSDQGFAGFHQQHPGAAGMQNVPAF